MSAYSESNLPAKRLLKAKLRSLADIPVPDSLKQKLFETIPGAQAGGRRFSPGRWKLMAAAAIVLLVGIVCMQNYGLLPLSHMEPNGIRLRTAPSDQNGVSVTDTNDANSPR